MEQVVQKHGAAAEGAGETAVIMCMIAAMLLTTLELFSGCRVWKTGSGAR